jgi:hypothetical protein
LHAWDAISLGTAYRAIALKDRWKGHLRSRSDNDFGGIYAAVLGDLEPNLVKTGGVM